ncbi:hypothetical protein D3C87_843710 [compost metagenome]
MKKTILFGLLLIFAILLKAESPIITKWNTNINNDGSTQIMIPVFGSYNYTYTKVGDASIMGNGNGGSLGTFTSKIITFPSVGEYIVKISPIAMFKFNFLSPSSNFRNKLTELQQWGTVSWIPDLSYLFYECKNLKITATDIPDFSNVTNMYHMFYFCESLTTIPSANSWNTGSVSNMYGMFRDAISFNQDIGNWDTHNVTNMATMFVNAYVFNKNIGSWNTGKVTSMLQMFGNAKSFNQNIGAWNTSNVTDMQAMFSGATAYNQIMGNWNTGKVTTMYGMFSNALAFNHDIGNWNTSNVTSMLVMFRDAKAFDQNIGKWPLKIGVDLTNLFTSSGMSCENYSRTLKGWAENNITPNNINVSTGCKIRTCRANT